MNLSDVLRDVRGVLRRGRDGGHLHVQRRVRGGVLRDGGHLRVQRRVRGGVLRDGGHLRVQHRVHGGVLTFEVKRYLKLLIT